MVQALEQPDSDVTAIEIDYEVGTLDPGRVFRSMAILIEALNSLDSDLARSVHVGILPEVRLERVEAGSIRAVLRTVLLQVDDDALKNLEWRPLVGQYLVKAKHRVLGWLDGKQRIETRAEVLSLQAELVRLAPTEAQGGALLPPGAVPVERLLRDAQKISDGVAGLMPNDHVRFISVYETTRVETQIRVSADDVEVLLTQETVSSETELVLLVKKPDYLGNSRWEFRLGDHTIEAKMLDELWLQRFRDGGLVLRPGDSLRAVVRTEVARGFESTIVATRYEVLRVMQIIAGDAEQGSLVES